MGVLVVGKRVQRFRIGSGDPAADARQELALFTEQTFEVQAGIDAEVAPTSRDIARDLEGGHVGRFEPYARLQAPRS